MRGHMFRATLLLVLAAGALGSASCTMREGQSNSYLIIERLEASAGGSDDDAETTLQSDVRSSDGGVFEDVGTVVFRLGQKDPASLTSSNNFVTVTRYRVSYLRTDGRNTPGIDVPHPFEGAFTVTVTDEGTAAANFVLVRIQAKRESPLPSLVGCGGGCAVTTIAEITFFGRDQAGRDVAATGRIQVDFADWAG